MSRVCIHVLSFPSLPRSVALRKNSTRLVSIGSALFSKNHRGWGRVTSIALLPAFAQEDHYEPRRSLQRESAGPLLSRQIAGHLSGPAPKNRRRVMCLDVLALLLRSIPGFCL